MNSRTSNGATTAVTRTSIQSRFGHTLGSGGGGSSTAAPSWSSTAQSLSTGTQTRLMSIGSSRGEARVPRRVGEVPRSTSPGGSRPRMGSFTLAPRRSPPAQVDHQRGEGDGDEDHESSRWLLGYQRDYEDGKHRDPTVAGRGIATLLAAPSPARHPFCNRRTRPGLDQAILAALTTQQRTVPGSRT